MWAPKFLAPLELWVPLVLFKPYTEALKLGYKAKDHVHANSRERKQKGASQGHRPPQILENFFPSINVVTLNFETFISFPYTLYQQPNILTALIKLID